MKSRATAFVMTHVPSNNARSAIFDMGTEIL